MKKIITAAVFAFLAVIGYYIGSAVAGDSKNTNSATDEPMGVMVVEEEYGVVTAPQAASQSDHNAKNHTSGHKTMNKNSATGGANSGEMSVEEEIEETESEN